MAYDLSQFKSGSQKALEWLQNEYGSIRTGRAIPAILDALLVEAYGSKMGIKELATVSIEDPKTLRVVPWDKTVAKDIDKAVRDSGLGLSVSLDATGLRLSFPELTSERRTLLTKIAKEKLEEARIKIRNERQRVLNDIDKSEEGEDEQKRSKNELQKLVDDANKKLEELSERKYKEILE